VRPTRSCALLGILKGLSCNLTISDDQGVMAPLISEFVVDDGRLRYPLRRAGVTLRRQGVSIDQLDEAVRLYREGWSCQRLAERYDCDDETVRQALKRAGIHLRSPWERP
jgi:Homeodomain-like domain-containing protein